MFERGLSRPARLVNGRRHRLRLEALARDTGGRTTRGGAVRRNDLRIQTQTIGTNSRRSAWRSIRRAEYACLVLIETQRPLPIGRVATLQIKVGRHVRGDCPGGALQEITGGSVITSEPDSEHDANDGVTAHLFRREVGVVGASSG
jgi:hypothetical protein